MRLPASISRFLSTSTFLAVAAGAATASVAHAAPLDVTPIDPTPQPLQVLDLATDREAISPDGDGAGDDVVVTFAIDDGSSPVDVRVVDRAGQTVATLATVDPSAGRARVVWDGDDAAGTPVTDGAYRIELAPIGEAWAAPASAVVPVRVDRRSPVVRIAARKLRLASIGARSVRVPLVLTERAGVRVTTTGSIGPSRTGGVRRAGRSSITVPITRAARARHAIARRHGAPVLLRIEARDAAGNRSTRRIALRVLPAPPLRLSWPINSAVSSGFGMRWGRPHQGIDLTAAPGTPIHAAADGRVIKAGWDEGFGQLVELVHEDGTETWYAHQSHIRVHVGQHVTRGQVIGLSGATGHVTGPHLHFEVHRGGSPIDPLGMLG